MQLIYGNDIDQLTLDRMQAIKAATGIRFVIHDLELVQIEVPSECPGFWRIVEVKKIGRRAGSRRR